MEVEVEEKRREEKRREGERERERKWQVPKLVSEWSERERERWSDRASSG